MTSRHVKGVNPLTKQLKCSPAGDCFVTHICRLSTYTMSIPSWQDGCPHPIVCCRNNTFSQPSTAYLSVQPHKGLKGDYTVGTLRNWCGTLTQSTVNIQHACTPGANLAVAPPISTDNVDNCPTTVFETGTQICLPICR